MDGARKVFIRVCAVLFYLAAFIAIQVGLHQYFSAPSSPQNHIIYNEEITPVYFPVLLKTDDNSGGNDGLLVRSLSMADYGASGLNNFKEEWNIYQDSGEGRLANSSLVTYAVESLSSARREITLSLGEENKRRFSIYIYEVEDNRIYPREYILQSYMGDNFSPIPFAVGLTFLIVLLGEKFVVKRLKTTRSTSTGSE
jgi:hypothetical protein